MGKRKGVEGCLPPDGKTDGGGGGVLTTRWENGLGKRGAYHQMEKRPGGWRGAYHQMGKRTGVEGCWGGAGGGAGGRQAD